MDVVVLTNRVNIDVFWVFGQEDENVSLISNCTYGSEMSKVIDNG